jgi:hypothetical protein
LRKRISPPLFCATLALTIACASSSKNNANNGTNTGGTSTGGTAGTDAGTGGTAGDGGSVGGDGGVAGAAAAGGTAGASEGCADGAVGQVYSQNMVGCDGATDQCQADALCAIDWHLCTLTEYAVQGGGDEWANVERWLAGCIRYDGSNPTCPPEDGICPGGCAAGATGNLADVTFACGAGVLESSTLQNIGVVAGKDIKSLGCNSAPCGFLDGRDTSLATIAGATCCRD